MNAIVKTHVHEVVIAVKIGVNKALSILYFFIKMDIRILKTISITINIGILNNKIGRFLVVLLIKHLLD